MSTTALLNFFDERRARAESLVLASVYETRGSTYSKAGARMLITGEGIFQGMLSGGCLEGDLAERARQVVDSGEPQQLTYDLGRNDEELWGLGVGCDGLMRIFLQPLRPSECYAPFDTMADVLRGDSAEVAATILESGAEHTRSGATLVSMGREFVNVGIHGSVAPAIESTAREVLASGRSVSRTMMLDGDEYRILFALLEPPPNILVLGAGLDAEPVVRMCAELGWRVTIQDHRPAYIENGNFSAARRVLSIPAEALAQELDLAPFDAAIVMSHHLVTDRKYLAILADTDIRYVGLLGPKDRRIRLMQDLGDLSARLQGRVHGPAGLDIGGRGPASIALSIVAQMHEALMRGRTDD